MKTSIIQTLACCLLLLSACSEQINSPEEIAAYPPIYPDYIGVTIPRNIAPLNFNMETDDCERMDIRIFANNRELYHQQGKIMDIPVKQWQKILEEANHCDSLMITVQAKEDGKWKNYRSFPVYLSNYPVDYGLVYRKIAPGYEVYSKMGIYQRDLSSFEETALVENTLVKGMCVNCHTFNQTNPEQFSLHIRGDHGATYLKRGTDTEYLNTKTDQTLASCVYPYWHPDGSYIAYSTNNTRQSFHVNSEERIEVIDLASDIVVYHPESHRLLHCDLLEGDEYFETYPAFSPDGKTLYFCQASVQEIPAGYKEIRYNLCSIAFEPDAGTFGNKIDTLILADTLSKSITFPRPSYDGKYILFTMADYGNFPIWHKEADLGLLDLTTNQFRMLSEVNSNDTESFHNWTKNSRWFVFSSRRDDGLYTRLYLASVDDDGQVSKPFMLPQRDPKTFYDRDIYSYNVPDFTDRPIDFERRIFEKKIVSDERIQVKSAKK